MENNLNFLSTRAGFNTALRYFKQVNGIIGGVSGRRNPADLINQALNSGVITQDQVRAILNALLVDKYNYFSKSYNLKITVDKDKVALFSSEVKTWGQLDLILSYYHPQLGILTVNPKNDSSMLSIADGLKENELVTLYIGNYAGQTDHIKAKKAFNTIVDFFDGGKFKNTKDFQGGSGSVPVKIEVVQPKPNPMQTSSQKPQEKPAFLQTPYVKSQNTPNQQTQQKPTVTPGGKNKLSPQYGILVANELFHNGNVEAWKKIITSYEIKYPDTKVLVFYDGEQIHDINTLFKWGKVKHGTLIFFSLLGPQFENISKLRRYLTQGASHMFESFLKGPPNQVLTLF